MSDNHKQDLFKKLIIIVIGSVVAAYGITLALYAGFGYARSAVARYCQNISPEHRYGVFYYSAGNDFICTNL